MEVDHINTFPVCHDDNSENVKKNVSFNAQSNVMYFDKEQSSSFLEGLESVNVSTFPDSEVENSKTVNSNDVSGGICNAESETPLTDDADPQQSKLNAIEKPSILLKDLVINLEKLPPNVLNKFRGENHVCGERSKSALLKMLKADLSIDPVQKKTLFMNQNEYPHISQIQDLINDKDTVQSIASDSLLTKVNTFRELKVSLQPLPDNLLPSLDKNLFNLQNSKQAISSSSVKPAFNNCRDQKSIKKRKHEVSKFKHKILKHEKLFKMFKQNTQHFEKGKSDSITPVVSVPINLEEDTVISKSHDHGQDDKVRTTVSIESGRYSTSCDADPLSLNHTSVSTISNVSGKSAKPAVISDNITASCASNSMLLSLLQGCTKEVTSDAETGVKDSSPNLINTVIETVNSTENLNSLTKEESNYSDYSNISFKKPVVILERLNLVLPEVESEGMNIQTTEERNLQIESNLHSQSTSGKVQKASKKSAKHKTSHEKGLKVLKKKKKIEKNLSSSKFDSRGIHDEFKGLFVNDLCEHDLSLLLFANNKNNLKKEKSTSGKKLKNESKSFKSAKKIPKFDLTEMSSGDPCEEDVPLLLFANKNYKKKQNYFTSKKMIKNKYKSFQKAKKFPKFDLKEMISDAPWEEDVPLLLFANENYKKEQSHFTSKKMLKNKYKSFQKAKNISKFDSKSVSKDVKNDLQLLSFANNNIRKEQNYFDLKKRIKNKSKSHKKTKKFPKFDLNFLSVDTLCEDDVPLLLLANNDDKKKQNNFASIKKIKNNKSIDKNSTSNTETVTMDHSYICSLSSMNAGLDSDSPLPLKNIEMDHNYVSCIPNTVPTSHVNNGPSGFPNIKSKKENNEKKTECLTCIKMDNPHVFLKTYLNKFCSGFDELGKKKKSLFNVCQKNKSDIQTARKNQEYAYNYIINKLHSHLEVSCSVKDSYKNHCTQNINSASLGSFENNNIAQAAGIQVSSENNNFTSLLHSETANEENNYDLSEMLFAAKQSSNNHHRSKSRIDKYRLGFLAANNPLRLYNKCLASERFLLSKYEMTCGQRRKLKKMFSALKNNAAAIDKIE